MFALQDTALCLSSQKSLELTFLIIVNTGLCIVLYVYLGIKLSQILCNGSYSHFTERKLSAEMVNNLPGVTYLACSKVVIHKLSSLDSKIILNCYSIPLSSSFEGLWLFSYHEVCYRSHPCYVCSICFQDFPKLHGYSRAFALLWVFFFPCNFLMLCRICSNFHSFCIIFVFPASAEW